MVIQVKKTVAIPGEGVVNSIDLALCWKALAVN